MKINRDLIGGPLIVLIGGFFLLSSATSLDWGSLRQMGPGMFPGALAVLLIGMGLFITVTASRRHSPFPAIQWRSAASVLLSIAAFMIVFRLFGSIAAIIALVIVASLGSARFRLRETAILAVVLAVMCDLVFRMALGMQLPAYHWPF